jgi:2-hydroxychromene-2-carboxylate isomerase/predicted O-methyltransferase YrrM
LSRPLEFWFEFASTYSYPAAMRLRAAARKARVEIAWRPFLLGPIFKELGWNDSPFNLQPAKGRYMWRDVARVCADHGLPFRRPSAFPRNGLLAARVAIAGDGEDWLPAFVERVYTANFAEDRDIAKREVVLNCLGEAGADSDAVLAAALSDENKARLRAQTELAIGKGIFGAPSFVVDGELFWGNDRLEHALARARGWSVAPSLGAPAAVPDAVLAIERDTASIGFDMASDRATGSLLRSLAASKPGGRLLEIGTGTGLATAWLADGMNTDATLDTIDSDAGVVEVARRHLDGDARIRFHVGDATHFISNLQGSYDLVFADAWPGKFTLLDQILDRMSDGGLYVVDDLLPQPNWPEGHGEKVERLLDEIDRRADLHATHFDWSTGVVVATRCDSARGLTKNRHPKLTPLKIS